MKQPYVHGAASPKPVRPGGTRRCRVCDAPLARSSERADLGWLCDPCLTANNNEPKRDLSRRSVRPIR